MRTYSPKAGEVTREWYVIDATDVVLGRLATHAATLLRGKHKPTFAPHIDGGDFVIIINAEKVALTGAKLEQKMAYRHSGYPGGLKATSYTDLLATNPRRAVEKAVRGHAPAQQAGPSGHQEAEGVRGSGPPPHRPAAHAVRDLPGRAVSARGQTEKQRGLFA